MVQRLLDAPNLPAFVNDLITTQATTVVGTEAAGFLVERADGGPGFRLLAHVRPDASTKDVREAAVKAFMDLVKPCVVEDKDGAIEIGPPGDVYHPESQYCLVTLLRSEGQAVAVSAVITRCLDIDRAKQRLQSMQLVAGYFELFTLRHNADQSRLIAQSHQHVLQLATAVATAEGFESAAMNLCNELATRASASRVSLGWLKRRTIRVRALSHTEEFDKKQELIVQLERAMEECTDQEEVVHFDPNGKGSDNVTRESQNLSRAQGGNIVLSLPLRRQAEVVGVVTLEFPQSTKLSPQVAHGLAVAVELLAPQLYDRFENDRWLITKAALSIKSMLGHAIGPRYMLAKLLIIVGILAVAAVVQPFWIPMYHVSAPFEFAAPHRLVISAPFEGPIQEIGRKPNSEPLQAGDRVRKGDVLAVLNTDDIQDKLIKAKADRDQARLQETAFRNEDRENKIAEANAAHAQFMAAQADVDLYTRQIQKSTIVAPFDGMILKGDLSTRIKQTVQIGEELFQITPDESLRAELTVAERDVQDVKPGARGQLATDSLPSDTFHFKVTRIIPLGNAKEGSNTFLVYGEPDPGEVAAQNPIWRPGMAGQARVDVERRTVIWIWTHRLIDFLRLKLWM